MGVTPHAPLCKLLDGSSGSASARRFSNGILLAAVLAVLFWAPVCNAQNPTTPSSGAPPASPPQSAPAQQVPASGAVTSQPIAQSAGAPAFATPPVAIVPIDKSIAGAALSVAGPLQAWSGRAYITGNGTITAGDTTAQVAMPYRGTMYVCASSTVKLATGGGAPAGEVPGLLIALDRGAVEMSFAASTAREQNADTLLTPYFRMMIGGPNAVDLSVRMGDDGDTCVDNAGANAPYVVVTSVFEGGLYRVLPGQRVMFEHGSLQKVVDQEKEPCGCPPPPKSEANEFPLAQSEGLAPKSPPATAANPTAGSGQEPTTLVYKGSQAAPQTVAIPPPPASPNTTGPGAPAAPAAPAKPGFFRKVGRFFKRIFGAE